MTGEELVFRIILSGLFTVIIEVLDFYLLGDVLAWWLSALMAVVLVFGGWLIWIDLKDEGF